MKKSVLTTMMLALGVLGAAAANHDMSITNLIGQKNVSGEFIDLNANTMLVDQYHGGKMILLYQQKKASAMLYTPVDQEMRWKKDNMGGIFQVTNKGLLNTNNTDQAVNGKIGFFTSLDNMIGNHVWTRYILPVYADDSANVVLGYNARWNSFTNDIEFNTNNELFAYRLSDGTPLWHDTISHYTRWGWNNVMYIPSTGNYLVWTDKLMLINPQTGIVKSINVNTGRYGVPVGVSKRDKRTDRGSDADYAFTPYVDRGYFTGIKSNIIFAGDRIYLADGEDLYCLDDNLNVLWYSQLPKDKTSAMFIHIKDDRITLLSSGVAYLEGCNYEVGKPFVAEFDVHTGRQQFISYLKIDGTIEDAHLGDDEAFYLTSNGLSVVSDFADPQVREYGKDVIGKVSEIGNKPKYALVGDSMKVMGTHGNDVLLVGKDGIDRVFDGNDGRVELSAPKTSLYDHPGGEIYTCMTRDKKGNTTDDPSNLVIAKDDGTVKAHFNTQFNGAFYNDGLLTIVMKTGIFSARL